MGWTTPPAPYSSGDVLPASTINTFSDDLNFLYAGHGTSFPGSPQDNQRYIYDADPANGVAWEFYYNNAQSKWVFIGGAPLWVQVATDESTTSGTYAALTTAGPAIAVPFAGVFDVEIGARMYPSATGLFVGYMSYDIGGTGAVDGDAIICEDNDGATGTKGTSVSYYQRKTGLTAVTLTAKYKVSSATAFHFVNRWMKLTPVSK